MTLLTVLGIVIVTTFMLLLIMLVVVIFSGINALYKNGHDLKTEPLFLRCHYCNETLIYDPQFFNHNSNRRGLLYCRHCGLDFKLYTTKNGLSVLEEVFGTPIDPRDEK